MLYFPPSVCGLLRCPFSPSLCLPFCWIPLALEGHPASPIGGRKRPEPTHFLSCISSFRKLWLRRSITGFHLLLSRTSSCSSFTLGSGFVPAGIAGDAHFSEPSPAILFLTPPLSEFGSWHARLIFTPTSSAIKPYF